MTAEAVVMNKSAVALAADSAVTITSGRRGIKTYDTVNKLFELIRGSGVGAMIYSNAEINGVPWETVIKCYRKEFASFRAPFLEDYVAHFTRYLETQDGLLRQQDEQFTVINTVYARLLEVFQHVEQHPDRFVAVSTGRVIRKRLHEVVSEALDLWDEGLAVAEPAPWADTLSASLLRKRYGEVIRELTKDLFSKFTLPAKTIERIVTLGITTLRCCVHEPGESGLVLAGFGSEDYFPKLYSVVCRGRLAGTVRLAHAETVELNLSRPGHLMTFAQDEPAHGFLFGITPEVREAVISFWQHWIDHLQDAGTSLVGNAVPEAQGKVAAAVTNLMVELATEQFLQFLDTMNSFHEQLHIKPMLDSVAALPKDELGVLAESLVNLTLLKQRMSIFESNTVGGAIDVAMISIGDGFVWLKRKHYFSRDLNPAWHLSHHATMLPTTTIDA